MHRSYLKISAFAAIACAALLPFVHWGTASLETTEATAAVMAEMPISKLATYYPSAPNNQILFSMILHGIDRLSPHKMTGETGALSDPRLLQLPSIAASAAAMFLLYFLALTLVPRPVAVLSTVVFGASFWRLIYSYRLRGYGLAIFLNLLNLWLIQQAIAKRRTRFLLFLPFTVAAAHYLLPTNLVYTAALGAYALYLIAHRRGPESTRLANLLGISLATGIALTGLLYFPIFDQVREAMTKDWGYRWSDFFYFRVLGIGIAYPVFFGLVSSWGLYFALTRGRRWRTFGVLLSLYFGATFLCFAAKAHPAPTRVYTALLPFWAMAFASGCYGAVALARPRHLRTMCLGLVCLVAVVSSGQVWAFVTWNHGLDPRRVTVRMAERVRQLDDFVIIATRMGRGDMELGDSTPYWYYYSVPAHLNYEANMFVDRDLNYRSRGQYYVLALDISAAQSALKESGVDRFLRSTLRLDERIGKIGIYTASPDDSVLEAYRRAAAAPSTTLSDRRDAWVGLGYDRIRRRDFTGAATLLEKAKTLAPDDRKTRFLLGFSRYLSFDNEKAAEEFKWVVTNDTENVDAPFYYADTLAARGHAAEALEWYRWYQNPSLPRGAWAHSDSARNGTLSVTAGNAGRMILGNANAAAWEKVSLESYSRGARERGAVAMEKAIALEPTPVRRYTDACMRRDAGSPVEAARLFSRFIAEAGGSDVKLSQFVPTGGGSDVKLNLARTLALKYRFDEARSIISAVQTVEPRNRVAAELAGTLARLR